MVAVLPGLKPAENEPAIQGSEEAAEEGGILCRAAKEHPSEAKARIHFAAFFGTTEVVPFHFVLFPGRFSAARERPLLLPGCGSR
jgi:hypothetical protein